MILEVCANSYESAINAEKGGAHRIELCENLSVGGLTPNFELAKKVINELNIPVFILIRPRGGNFIYSNEEFEQIKKDIILFKKIGCKGIVSGRIQHFISRKAMDIDGLGAETVNLLVENKLINNYSDIYRLKVEDLLGLERMAEKSYENLIN
jgi:copper homeostasis protein CutC